jgi:hypothetical protein
VKKNYEGGQKGCGMTTTGTDGVLVFKRKKEDDRGKLYMALSIYN